jgi:hypothetical protein
MMLTTIPAKTIMSNTFEFLDTFSSLRLRSTDEILITQGRVPVKKMQEF